MSARAIRGLYAIADAGVLPAERLVGAAAQAIAGGARVIQYRDKTGRPAGERARLARALAALCRGAGVLFIVNDDPELAATALADGVHLGRDDLPVGLARARLGAGRLVGVSCYDDLARAREASAAGADYVAFGSFYPSATKPQAVRAGVELLRQARARLRVPVVAIGGITPENGARLIAAGADALAVITGIFAQPDIEAAARRYARLFEHEPHEAEPNPI